MSRGGRSTAAWTLADQLVASSTNALLSVLVARSVDAYAFGAFALAFLVFSFALGLVRGLVTDPLLVSHAADTPDELRLASAHAAGASLSLGCLGSLLCLLAGFALSGTTAHTLIALAGVLPGLLVQDAWRRAFFAAGRPFAAFVNDTLWSVLQIGGVLALTASGAQTVWSLLLVWGVTGAFAALLGVHQLGAWPLPVAGMRWFWQQREMGVRLGLDFLISQGAFLATLIIVSATVGMTAVGAIRAGQVLLAPVQVLLLAVSSFGLPVLARAAQDPSLNRTVWVRLTTGSLACGVLWVAPLLLLPDRVGSRLLGASWEGAAEVLPLLAVQMLLIACATGPALALKSLGRASVLLRFTLVQAPLLLGASLLGALWWGAPGVAGGFVVAHLVGTFLIARDAVVATRARTVPPRDARRARSSPGSPARGDHHSVL